MEHIPHFNILEEGVNRTDCNINRKEYITASFIFHEVLMGIQRRQDRIFFSQRPGKKLNRAWFACGRGVSGLYCLNWQLFCLITSLKNYLFLYLFGCAGS